MPDELNLYSAAWAELRKRRRYFFLSWLLYIPVAASGEILGERFLAFKLGFPIAIAWIVLFFALGVRVQLFRCPRCGNPVFSRRIFGGFHYHNAFSRKCLNCGIRIGAGPESDASGAPRAVRPHRRPTRNSALICGALWFAFTLIGFYSTSVSSARTGHSLWILGVLNLIIWGALLLPEPYRYLKQRRAP